MPTNEPDTLPRHLWIALVNAQRAFEKDNFGALATINEDIQGLVDAAMACRSRAIVIAEARGQAQEERASACLRAYYAGKFAIGDPKACWDDIIAAAERHGARSVGTTHASSEAIAAIEARVNALTAEMSLEGAQRALGDFLTHAPADFGLLLEEIRRLTVDRDQWRVSCERAAADENDNAAELAAVRAELAAVRAELAAVRAELAVVRAQDAGEDGADLQAIEARASAVPSGSYRLLTREEYKSDARIAEHGCAHVAELGGIGADGQRCWIIVEDSSRTPALGPYAWGTLFAHAPADLRALLVAVRHARAARRDAEDAARRAAEEAYTLLTTIRFALGDNPAGNGWKPAPGVHPVVDLALKVSSEHDAAMKLRAERDEARKMLAECYVLSGADTDGNTAENGWVHLWRGAVDEVRELRANYDEMLSEDHAVGG